MKLHILLLVVLILTAGCVQQTGEETIRIGGLFALTGFGVEWGETDMNGAIMAIDEANERGGINGRRIEFVVEDTKSDFANTATVVRKLAMVDGVKVIIGPTWGEFSEVAIPVAEEQKIVLVSPSSGGELESYKSEYFFRTWPTERFEIQAVVGFAKEANYSKSAIVFNENSWSQSLRDMFEEEANKSGIIVVDTFQMKPGETDYRTVITKLKQMDIDFIYAPFVTRSDMGLFFKQAKELNLNAQAFSTSSTESPELVENFGEYVEGLLYAYPDRSTEELNFSEKYRLRFGKEPSSPSAPFAYDAANAVIHTLEKNPQSQEELISALLSTDFQGVTNKIKFDEFGSIASKEFVIKKITNMSFVVVE